MTCRQHRNLPPAHNSVTPRGEPRRFDNGNPGSPVRSGALINPQAPWGINQEAPLDGLNDHWEPPPKSDGWWSLLVVTFAVVLAGIAVYSCTAHAHMRDRPDLDHWLMTLYSMGRGPCCDSHEAETMADPDWRNASEMKKGECAVSGGTTGPLEPIFCVRLENPDVAGDWHWWIVPAAAVVELPNRAGPALIWLIWNNRGLPDVQPYIRCFLRGTES